MNVGNQQIKLADFTIANNLPFILIAGPCQMESRQHSFDMAGKLKEIAKKYNVPLVYKSSFDKANRTSLKSKRGIGLDKALEIFVDIKKEFFLPITTDVHIPEHCDAVKNVVDIIQIPAFLCRQTDLLVAAAETSCIVNVKKGQFLAPWDMKNVIEKIVARGNKNVLICERGSCFGYNKLVNDMSGLKIMAKYGSPVIFDAGHSSQEPGGLGGSTGGNREFIEVLARAATAVGIAGLFVETHQDPDNAPSDGPNMITPEALDKLLKQLVAIDKIIKGV